MQRQGSFSQAEYAGKKKQTRRDRFLAEMEAVVPWARLVERLRPLYPKGERGRPPIGLERMLRIHFLQQWYGLADGAMEDALYDSQALRGFAGIDLTVAGVPEETTILNFRNWLERHELSQALFAEVSAMLEERGLLMRQGTIVDATIIAAPPSTKNKSKARDPEMRPVQEYRAAAHPVRSGQPGDRQEDPACPIPGLITPGLCLNPGNDSAKPRCSPSFRQPRPLPGTPRSTNMPRSLTHRLRPLCSVFP